MAKTSNQREAVRLLAIEIGVRPAARKLGLNEDTVCSWAKRDNWFVSPANPQTLQAPQAKPGDVLLSELETLERQTKASLARSAANLATQSEKAKLRDSGNVKNVAQTAAIVHRWDQKDQSTSNVVVNVALLGISPATVSSDSVLDVDSECRDSGQ